MKKIKSFKEYIEEQELLKEASYYSDEFEKAKSVTDNNANNKTDNKENINKPIVGADKEKDAPYSSNSITQSKDSEEVGNVDLKTEPLNVIDPIGFLKIDERDSDKKIRKLKEKLSILENTYNNLYRITESILKPVTVSKGENKDNIEDSDATQKTNKQDVILNISRGKSCASFYNEYKKLLTTAKEKLESSNKVAALINQLKNGNLKQRQAAYNELQRMGISLNKEEEGILLGQKGKESQEPKPEQPTDDEIKTESIDFDTLDESLTGNRFGTFLKAVNPFSRTNTGIRTEKLNKFSSDKILKTSSKSKYAQEYLKQAYTKYVSDTRKSIDKNKPYIASDLRAANKLINNYIKKHRYTHVPDQDYIFNITAYLDSAYKILLGVGSDIATIATNFGKAMQTKLNDIGIKTKQNEELPDSLNTKTAMRKVQDATQRSERRKEIIQTAKDKITSKVGEVTSKLEQDKADKEEYNQKVNTIKDYTHSHFNKIFNNCKNKTLSDALIWFKNTYLVEPKLNDFKDNKKLSLPDKTKFDYNIDKQKKAAAEAFLIFAQNKKNLDKKKNSSFDSEKIDEIFDSSFNDVFKKYDEKSYLSILNHIKNKLIKEKSNNPKQVEAIKSTTDGKPESDSNTTPKAKEGTWMGREKEAAKNFDGEQPKSIYAYAIQKAKKLQER